MRKVFSDRYAYKAGRRLFIEVAQSCPQCQLGSDYGHRAKTTGAIQSRGPWDTLSVDIVGPLPANHRHGFSSCLLIAIRGTPFLSQQAITQQAR